MDIIIKKYAFRSYIFFTVCSIFILLMDSLLNISPWMILLTVLLLIFLPGFTLSQIFKIDFSDSRLGQIILWLSLGLIFNLTVPLLAILFGFTITVLANVYLATIIILFLLAFILDLRRPNIQDISIYDYNVQKLFRSENLIYFFLFVLMILVMITVNQVGGNFRGDSQYHLSIMRKAIEGFPLTVDNLSFVKNQIDLAYGIPVWHVFLTMVTKLFGTNIFTLWTEISTALTLLVFLIWFWLFRQFLPNRQVGILALFLFIFYYFALDGYFYTRLALPDTLNQLLLLPLCFGLTLKYIFDDRANYKHLIILTLLIFFMGIIHWSQYFYFILGIGLFGIIYAIFMHQEKNFSFIWRKIIYVLFTNMIIVVPVIIFLELKSHAISQDLQIFPNINTSFNNDSFIKFNPYAQLSFLLLPLMAIFLRTYRRLSFVFAVFLVCILVFNIPYLEGFLLKYLSPIFVKRLYTNLGEWPYVIWALTLSFIFVLIDRHLKISKLVRGILNFFILMILAIMIFSELEYQTISMLYDRIFSPSLKLWIGDNYYWLISVVVLSALALFLSQKYYPKLLEYTKFQEYQYKTTNVILMFIVIFFLGSKSIISLQNNFNKELANWRFFSDISANPVSTVVNMNRFGGTETIDFIRNNIPAKSIFNSSGSSNMVLPMLVDVYAASFPFGKESTGAYQNIYKVDIPVQDRLKSVNDGKIEYILYAYSNNKANPFTEYPQYFTKIFDNGNAAIYMVEKEQVGADAK